MPETGPIAPPDCPHPPSRTSCVLLLSLSGRLGAGWHARLIGPDACVHEFDSPFELARYLARAPLPDGDEAHGGLR